MLHDPQKKHVLNCLRFNIRPIHGFQNISYYERLTVVSPAICTSAS